MCEWVEFHYCCSCAPTCSRISECEDSSCKNKVPGTPSYEPKDRWQLNYGCKKCDPCHWENQGQASEGRVGGGLVIRSEVTKGCDHWGDFLVTREIVLGYRSEVFKYGRWNWGTISVWISLCKLLNYKPMWLFSLVIRLLCFWILITFYSTLLGNHFKYVER